ncbi:5-oxoprolinase [Mycobacteroides abscessus subsp. abscessus]|nr:5-oxoprolinase [Mycobacteroides abscessus subsp. abscessus]
MNFGSWSLAARGIQEEAMLLPGIKLVERGTVRADLWSMLMGMTRMPTTVGLDFKAMIAANNVAVGRRPLRARAAAGAEGVARRRLPRRRLDRT